MLASASFATCAKAGVRPVARHGGVPLTVALDVYALAHYGTAQTRSALYAKVLAQFEKAHPGIHVRQVPFLPTPQNETAIIAGTAPDVFPDCWADVAGVNLAYASSQAAVIDANWWAQITARKVGVHTGFTQADHAVNALQGTASAQRTRARAAAAHYPSKGPRIATVPPGL